MRLIGYYHKKGRVNCPLFIYITGGNMWETIFWIVFTLVILFAISVGIRDNIKEKRDDKQNTN